MLDPVVRLQERDARRLATEKELRAVPIDVAAVEKALASARASIEAERSKLKELELQAKQTEHAIQTTEQRSAKLKGQQMQVKKNDEYQALGREIDGVAAEQAKLEEEELGLLYRLDQERESLKKSEGEHKAAVAELDARLAKIREREKALKARLEGESAEVASARAGVAAPILSLYDRLLKIGRFPVLAQLNGQTCGGCHMRVSNDVEQEARKGGKVVACGNCGRIVFLPA